MSKRPHLSIDQKIKLLTLAHAVATAQETYDLNREYEMLVKIVYSTRNNIPVMGADINPEINELKAILRHIERTLHTHLGILEC